MNRIVGAVLIAAYIVGGGFILTATGIVLNKIFFRQNLRSDSDDN